MALEDHEVRELIVQLKEENRIYRAEVKRLRAALKLVEQIGHSDDCLFCGFKDKRCRAALRGSDGGEER